VQTFGCPAKVLFFAHSGEIAEMPQLHKISNTAPLSVQ
jgi:hypothetical protein